MGKHINDENNAKTYHETYITSLKRLLKFFLSFLLPHPHFHQCLLPFAAAIFALAIIPPITALSSSPQLCWSKPFDKRSTEESAKNYGASLKLCIAPMDSTLMHNPSINGLLLVAQRMRKKFIDSKTEGEHTLRQNSEVNDQFTLAFIPPAQ